MGLLNLLSIIHDDHRTVARGSAKGPCATLLAHGIDPERLKFTLNQDGSVTVSGRVRDQSECDRICRIIDGMSLLEGVKNDLIIDAIGPAANNDLKKATGDGLARRSHPPVAG